MTRFRLTLRMLSPVHVGTGEVLTPESYVIRQEEGGAVLAAIDLSALLSSLTPADRDTFNRAADAGDFVAIRRFIRERSQSGQFDLWVAAVDNDLRDRYEEGMDRVSAELAIHPMTRTGLGQRPYVPGSSIKGAIRTAVLQRLVDTEPGHAEALHDRWPGRSKSDGQNLEADVLGYLGEDRSGRPRAEIRADPFRAVRITDAPIQGNAVATFVGRVTVAARPSTRPARARGRPRSDPSGIQLYYEVTYSALSEGAVVEAVGEMTLDERLAQADAREAWGRRFPHPVAQAFRAAEILDSCNVFYSARLRDEALAFGAVSEDLKGAYADLQGDAEAAQKRGEAILRLGRFSHVECMTLAPPLRSATGGGSRTTVGGWGPLGWAALRLEPVQP